MLHLCRMLSSGFCSPKTRFGSTSLCDSLILSFYLLDLLSYSPQRDHFLESQHLTQNAASAADNSAPSLSPPAPTPATGAANGSANQLPALMNVKTEDAGNVHARGVVGINVDPMATHSNATAPNTPLTALPAHFMDLDLMYLYKTHRETFFAKRYSPSNQNLTFGEMFKSLPQSIVSDVDDLASDAVVLKKKISKFQTENNALKAKHDSERKELIKKQAAESAALHMPVKDKVDAFHTKMDLYYQRGFGDFENKLAEIAAIKKDLEQTPEQMQLMCCEPHEIKYLSDSQLGPHFKPRVDAKVAAYRADLQQKLAAVKASMPGRPVDLELAPPYSSLGYPGVRSMVPATPRLLPRPRKRKRGLLWMMGKVLQVLASSAQERLGKGPKPPKTLWLRC